MFSLQFYIYIGASLITKRTLTVMCTHKYEAGVC